MAYQSAQEWQEALQLVLDGINKYNPENIDLLEQCVMFQVENNEYHFEANLALMKLYQFQPSRFNNSIACKILVKAITALPQTHFTLLLSVLPHNQQSNEDVEKVSLLHTLLESCSFDQFWTTLADNLDVVEGVNGFVDNVKKFITDIVNNTYQSVDTEILRGYLRGVSDTGLSDKEFEEIVAEQGWRVEGGVTHIRGHQEHIRPKRILAKIEFDSIAAVIAQCST